MSKNIDQIFIANPITSNAATDLIYIGQSPYGAGNDAAITYANFAAQFGASYTPSALTKTDDTNVTLTLGGSPTTALLHATSLTLGWTGVLSGTRGGTGVNNGASTITIDGNVTFSGAFTFTGTITGNTTVTFPTSGTLATTSQLPTPAALTKVDDTNITLTLGGTPTTSLLQAVSLTLGWTGTLSGTRGGTGVNNGSNTITYAGNINFANSFTTSGNFSVTQAYTGITNVTFPTSGTLATTSQIPTGAALTKTDDTNVTLTLGGSPSTALVNAASLTLGWTGVLSGTRGGTGVNNGASTITVGGNVAFSGAFTFTGTITGNTAVTFPTSGTLATTSQLPTPAALTSGNDTNVTLTLGGTPATALLQASSITAGWTGQLAVGRGGTGAASFNINGLVITGATTTTALSSLTLTNGQLVIGSTAGAPTAATLTAGTNISITNGANSITINSTAAGGITNVNQNSSSATLSANTRYATNNGASLVTYTIPAGAAVGDTYIIVGGSSGGWTVAQPASVVIHLGNAATTSGVGGSISSTNQYDSLTITCVASNVFTAYAMNGNLTVV